MPFNINKQELNQNLKFDKETMPSADQPTDVGADKVFFNTELKELVVVIVFALLSTVLMIHLNAFDKLYRFSRNIDSYDFDEIAVFLPSFLAIGFVLYSYRRIQRLESEMNKRREVEKRLLKSEEIYKKLSITDDLTQLYNSRFFYEKLKEEINRLIRYKQPLSLLLVDIDDFKQINDRYGHLKGDKVLKIVGIMIQDCLRKTDTAYRYGGEEFTVILPGTKLNAAKNVAERIRKRFEEQEFSIITDEKLNISVSIGVSQFKRGEKMEGFVKRTDNALYIAKQKGKNMTYASQ